MDIESIKSELRKQRTAYIERQQKQEKKSGANNALILSENYSAFKTELKTVLMAIIGQHKLDFRNSEQSHDFLYKLKPEIDDLLNRFFAGQ